MAALHVPQDGTQDGCSAALPSTLPFVVNVFPETFLTASNTKVRLSSSWALVLLIFSQHLCSGPSLLTRVRKPLFLPEFQPNLSVQPVCFLLHQPTFRPAPVLQDVTPEHCPALWHSSALQDCLPRESNHSVS